MQKVYPSLIIIIIIFIKAESMTAHFKREFLVPHFSLEGRNEWNYEGYVVKNKV